MISGLFEVHLITTPEQQTRLFAYVTDLSHNNNNLHLIPTNPRPTCAQALYGDYPVQPMLTFWLRGDTDSVTKTVNEVVADMTKKGMPILRIKIESMAHNDGVPDTMHDEHYCEYHFKVKIESSKDWNRLVELLTPYGAHLFYNPYNKTMKPIITIRRYTSLKDLEALYVSVNKMLTAYGFVTESPEREYSVYDSNVNLDKNWLFESEPSNFIVKVQPEMLFAY